ncbi:hypothetical protein [Flavisolibacter tropicus]|uniref:hypothetical protein n=1 Tax=Flavisolibacter tropicus TaxID=1492898 RepID=UPI0011E020CA|nr:hypothetical protein [Flavisolibacter tropicus]
MYKKLSPILLLLFSLSAFPQSSFKKNDVYGEFMGNGIFASLNYERQLTNKPGLGVRAGIGYFSGDEKFRLSVPLGVNYLFTLNINKSFLDVGVGGTWSGSAGLMTLKQEAAAGGRDYSEHIWSLVPSLGYRRHTKSDFMWRVNFTPIFNKYRAMPWIGISIGKRF